MEVKEAITILEQRAKHKECTWEQIEEAVSVVVYALRSMPEAEELSILKRLEKEYLEICDEDCAGDPSVGIQPCEFFQFEDMDDSGQKIESGCMLKKYLYLNPLPEKR